jgi:hypothetical protein
MTVLLALTLAALLVAGTLRYLHEWLSVGPRLDAAKAALLEEQ